jgi:ribosomal protein S6
MEERSYELNYLISPDLTQAEVDDLVKKIEGLTLEEKGVKKTELPKRIKLSYPIKKEEEAFLVSLKFKMEPQKTEYLKKEIEKEKNILRYLLIKTNIENKKDVENKKVVENKKDLFSKNLEKGEGETEEKFSLENLEKTVEKTT